MCNSRPKSTCLLQCSCFLMHAWFATTLTLDFESFVNRSMAHACMILSLVIAIQACCRSALLAMVQDWPQLKGTAAGSRPAQVGPPAAGVALFPLSSLPKLTHDNHLSTTLHPLLCTSALLFHIDSQSTPLLSPDFPIRFYPCQPVSFQTLYSVQAVLLKNHLGICS